MARPRGIPDRLVEAVLAEAGAGKSTREISAWLKAKHKLVVGHNAVARFLRERKAERKAAAEAVIAERTAQKLTADFDAVDAEMAKLQGIAAALREGMVTADGKPGTTLLDRIGQTPRVLVYEKIVARIQSIAEERREGAGAGKGGATGPSSGVAVLPPEDPNA